METKKKNDSGQPEQAADAAAKKPLKVFVVDNVSASVFAREYEVQGDMRTFYNVAFSRSYRDDDNRRRYVSSFNLEDLGKVVSVAQQADAFIRSL